jgi:hypothetical protein
LQLKQHLAQTIEHSCSSNKVLNKYIGCNFYY